MNVIIYYDKDDHPIAEGRSAHDLARKLGVTPQAVSHGLHRGSRGRASESCEGESRRDGEKGVVMVQLNIDMPTSCETCPYKGARWCYLEVLRGKESQEVPEDGRAEWCPMEEVEDDSD